MRLLVMRYVQNLGKGVMENRAEWWDVIGTDTE